MRKLLIVRGPQGSGKTTLIKNLGLEGFRVSADIMRTVRTGLVLNSRGNFVINQEDAHQVWEMVRQSLDRRFSRGEFVAVDATFPAPREYNEIIDQAKSAGYKVAIVDLYGMDIEELHRRNIKRPVHERISERGIEKTIANYEPHDVRDDRIDDFFDCTSIGSSLERWINAEVRNLDPYEEIIHIGDLQGVFEAMFQEGSPITRKLEDSKFYIFVGDALDRGLENGEVLHWILEEVRPRLGKNAVWIYGNHEKHLRDLVQDNEILSWEFEYRTLPQLIKTNPSTTEIRDFLSKMEDVFIYRHAGENVIVTHAGLPAVPDNVMLVPAYQAMLGVGGFGEDVDERFSEWASEQDIVWRQVHGHRNRKMHPARVNEHSFNLEGQAEFGGHIRIAVKNREGWTTRELRNQIFRQPKEWRDINKDEGRKPHSPVMPIPAWIERGERVGYLRRQTLEEFIEHRHVNIRTQESRPNIDTIAFSKGAFYSKTWDGITNKARGLFIDNRDRRIIARSWNKFFNLGEKTEVELEHILENWTFPMTVSLKANGFLGLAAWDPERHELILSSKGSMEGEFAELFREVAEEVLGHAGIERLTRAVRDLNGTATFEVISPAKDPHIVEYEKNGLVLLDFIHNAEVFEKLDHEKLQKLGDYIGVEVRRVIARAPNRQALESIAAKLKDLESGLYKMHIEGVVVEDSAGNFVKIKSGWYDMWKRARGLVERLALQRRKGQNINLEIPEELEGFMAWIMMQEHSITDLPIIELRKRYLESPEEAIAIDHEAIRKAHEEAERRAKNAREVDGFMRGYEAILSQVRQGTASHASIRKLIDRGTSKIHLAEAMKAREDYSELVRELSTGDLS